MATEAFQRARRPDQVEARRQAIVAAARGMLAERGVSDISLRELSDRVGLAKSNVLRYFDSREAIFLEILEQEWTAWLDDLETDFADIDVSDRSGGPYGPEERIGRLLARSLAARPLLCELITALAGVLERNISLEFARTFKSRATLNTGRLVKLLLAASPDLGESDAWHFAGGVNVLIGGLWPYVHPAEAVAQVTAELGYLPASERFLDDLTDGVTNQLVGLIARARVRCARP